MFVEAEVGGQQGCLFVETAKLSEMFFEQLKRHPVPVEESAIKSISNNSQAIDIYCFLAYRLHALSVPTLVSWKGLMDQFGTGVSALFKFRQQFRSTLELAMAVYPEAKVEVMAKGVILHPSPPPVSPKIISMAPRRRQDVVGYSTAEHT